MSFNLLFPIYHYEKKKQKKKRLFKYTENFTSKYWKFSDKSTDIFHISAQSIDCGYSCGSNEYPQSMFLNKNKKIMYTPVNPNFTI